VLKVMRLKPNGDPAIGWKPSHITSVENFTSDDHSERDCPYYTNAEETVFAGVWECAPCKAEVAAYPVDELMTVISGSVTVTNADGTSETFKAGDSFFIAKGTKCTWHITEKLRKYYMIAT
jgi:uncharacterized cupin superfamily protein